jgi:membrane fusion protein (multidrug efflux system)
MSKDAAPPAGQPEPPAAPKPENKLAAPPADKPAAPAPSTPAASAKKGGPRWALWIVALVVLVGGGIASVPYIKEAQNTVSTDDAYVNGHVTFVAPRVPGQVERVLVEDNMRVRKGTLLLQLDRKPYQVQVEIAQAAVDLAQTDLAVAESQARSMVGQARSSRFNMDRAIEDVHNQVALLHSKVAFLESQKANLVQAQNDYERSVPLLPAGAITEQELDHRKQAYLVVKAQVEEALQGVYQVRVSLGLPPIPKEGEALGQTPADLDQTYSAVRQAQATLLNYVAQLGIAESFDKTPAKMIEDFYKRDPEGNIDRIYIKLLKDVPLLKQAQAKLNQAQRKLDEARLNLSFCDVVAEIDGIVTRREVNPGNNVVAGQSLMALRSATEIWIDANFKETQLTEIRIGHPVDLYVDMYGSKQSFKGRVSGFTMGTGSTLALLPAENATGNFVKVVQRLPVKIELIDYDPDKAPLFIGLSVRPVVRIKEAPTGTDAGKVLQPYAVEAPR